MGDFKTFYCAAQVAYERGNPYDSAPLGRCELLPAPRPLYVPKPGLVLPAPLPGYAIAAFVPFALMPFLPAAVLWFLVLSVATLVSILLLVRIGAGDAWTIGVALAIPLIAISFVLGQVVPVALLGVVLTAFAVQREASPATSAMVVAGIALAFAEPQAGVAVAIACALLGRRHALAVAVAVGLLAAVSLVSIGFHANLVYLREVVPAQLAAELPVYFQYSTSWIAAHLGMGASHAVDLGRLQWLAMLGITAAIARSAFAKRHPEGAVLAASALAVAGGPYLHLQHVALALPAALWLARNRQRESKLATVAVIALALPLLQFFLIAGRTPAALALALYLAVALWLGIVYGGGLRGGLVSCAATACAILIAATAFAITGFGFGPSAPTQAIASQMAQASWAHFAALHYAASSPAVWIVKAPTWLGLGAAAGGLIGLARGYGKRQQLPGATNYAT